MARSPKVPRYRIVNSFKILSLDKIMPTEHPAEGCLEKYGRPWYCPPDAGFEGMQNARVGRLPPIFQRNEGGQCVAGLGFQQAAARRAVQVIVE